MAKRKPKPDPITPAKLRASGWKHSSSSRVWWIQIGDLPLSIGDDLVLFVALVRLRTVRDFADLCEIVRVLRGEE